MNAVHLCHLRRAQAQDTVLVAEDYEEMRNEICRCLSPHFFVVVAPNGRVAWEMVARYLPNLVIANQTMAGIDGIALCRHIKSDERTNHIPVIMLTGSADIDTKIEGLNSGADDLISKPFQARELRARACNLIRGRKTLLRKYYQAVELRNTGGYLQSKDEKFHQKVMSAVEAHIDDHRFSVEVFAREVGVSTVQLYRKLLALTGLSPNNFVRDVRLQRSALLLEEAVGNVADAAYASGFNSLSYFSKCFRKKFGCRPKEFAKKSPQSASDGRTPGDTNSSKGYYQRPGR